MTPPRPDILHEARLLGATLRRFGSEWVGPCRLCGGRDRFSINTTKQIFNCRGCQRGGDVFDLAKLVHGVEFAEAVRILGGDRSKSDFVRSVTPPDDKPRRDRANWLWQQRQPPADSPVEIYLRARGYHD